MLWIIEDSSWTNIRAKLAWLASQKKLPQGLIWKLWVGWAMGALISWVSIIAVIVSLWVASPRLLWIVSRALWISTDKLTKFINLAKNNLPESVQKLPVKESLRTWIKTAWITWPILDNTNK